MNDSLPTISVVVPFFNARDTIGRALRSVLAQAYPVREIVCVDDGSTDDTARRVERIAAANPDLIRVVRQENGGAPRARNRGLREVSGTFIQFLDADDELLPGKLARQADLVAAAEGPVSLVAAAFDRVYPSGQRDKVGVRSDVWEGLIAAELGITSANLWSRAAVEAAGGWDEALPNNQDAFLMLRLIVDGGHVLLDHEPAALVHRREGSVWNENLRSSYRGWMAFRRDVHAALVASNGLTPERESLMRDIIFDRLRRLYASDPSLARELHGAARRFGLPVVPVHESVLYRVLYGLVGFSGAEIGDRVARKAVRVARGATTRVGLRRS